MMQANSSSRQDYKRAGIAYIDSYGKTYIYSAALNSAFNYDKMQFQDPFVHSYNVYMQI